MNHGRHCRCCDCENERTRYRTPRPWRQLRDAALGYAHELPEVVEYLLDRHEPGAVLDAARDAHDALVRAGEHAAARSLAEEVEAQC